MALAAQPTNLQIENVVLNLPRHIRCNKCRNTMAKDTKINSRKEKSSGNLEYLGIKNTRFHFNCTQCSAWGQTHNCHAFFVSPMLHYFVVINFPGVFRMGLRR
ncbi:hypothetical protein Pyn_38882 [Prunus yedoensis var. nudiflora]|uniref:Uncharacterized protein n=1 Tax=Prunus yedoensis var. nudiflora TaxID=2094558 RepID=A0A314ZKU7_PRUYE|nr:hypothetical protein Pyn_38882 [Prunus yedoensis var. nudiflora]